MEQFEAYFQRADLNRDGRISGEEAVAFFQGFNLPKNVLAQIWMHSDPKNKGFLNQPEFFNALRLATVAQSRKDLTKEIVKAALEGPAAAKIPPPRIYSVLAPTTTVNSMSTTRPPVNSALLSPLSSMGSIPATPSSNVATHRQQMPLVTGPNQQVSSNIMKPFHGTPSSSLLVQPVNQSLPGGGTMAGPHPPSSNFPILTTDWPSGSRGGSLAKGIPGNGTTSLGDKDGLAPASSVLMTSAVALPKGTTSLSASLPPKPVNSLLSSAKTVDKDLKASIASANGFSSDSIFGDVFSASKIKQESSLSTVSTSSVPVTTYTGTVATGNQPPRAAQVNSLDSMPTILAGVGPLQQNQSFVKQNQQNAVTIGPVSTSTAQLGNPGVDMAQPPWPKMSQSSIQKYTKVFLEVDKDRDGKITGEQARNLFLSWRLPREILKQVWDLSDQDGDSMLSLREFCIALYLMERYREGRPVPNLLPNSLLYDESLLRVSSQLSVRQGGVAWQPSSGMPNTQPVMPAAGFKSQQQVQMPPQVEVQVQPAQKKRTVPVLEKHLINQLSNEEQSALNSKLKEAADADKKVEELEKEILDSKEKIEFYRTKMQELVLYKSRCDNRLNEIMERVSADKREVEVLAKKYEEKYKHVGDVASKLTAEEATFRDIQEKKLQLFNAIVKINEGGDVNGSLQDRASQVQSDLDDLVRKLNDRCKQYGLRAKPTSLLELPFGWQTGIQEGAADWDEDWDKFENEEFKLVKELTVNVENTVAPPKSKPPTSSNNKEVSKKDSSPHAPPDIDSAAENSAGAGNWPAESEIPHAHGENGSIGSPSSSPPGKNALGSVREFSLPKFETDDVKDNQSDHGGAESTVSSEKHADDHLRVPSFDAHDDADSLWGFNPSYKESGDDRNKHDFSFGSEDFGLNPIRTGSPSGSSLYGKDRSPFFDSVPPSASSVYGKERSPFFDSVPGTPAFDSVFSPRYGEGLDKSFGFDRFDSFSSQGNLSRFDSMRSSKDFDPSNFFSQQEKLTRFDSIRSTSDFGHSQGFPSFDGSDPFGSGPFKSSETPRSSDNWSSF